MMIRLTDSPLHIYCLALAIALAFTIITLLTGAASPDPKPEMNRFEGDICTFEEWDAKNAWPQEPILFVGSSSIRMWRTRDAFPDLPLINRGFGGSQISDVLHFNQRIVLRYQPRLIVFYCGDNDIAANKSPQRVFADYQRFVKEVHAQYPQTPIIFITIKPSGSRWHLWPQMKQANELIRTFSQDNELLHYADCATCLLTEDGRPDDSLFLPDKLHLNDQGYQHWQDVLRPIINAALNSRAR